MYNVLYCTVQWFSIIHVLRIMWYFDVRFMVHGSWFYDLCCSMFYVQCIMLHALCCCMLFYVILCSMFYVVLCCSMFYVVLCSWFHVRFHALLASVCVWEDRAVRPFSLDPALFPRLLAAHAACHLPLPPSTIWLRGSASPESSSVDQAVTGISRRRPVGVHGTGAARAPPACGGPS